MHLKIEDFTYTLAEDRIAKFPVNPRHHSKLIVSHKDQITHDYFVNVADHLPENSLLILNNTKVIRARLIFRKQTGAAIEIFCLEPMMLRFEMSDMLNSKNEVLWKCLIGNRKKWKHDEILEIYREYQGQKIQLTAKLEQAPEHENIIRFAWNGAFAFSEILSFFGHTPLPPYLKRDDVESDLTNYQTCYASRNGAVAAPTAGLHFSQEVFDKLQQKGIKKESITLHVSAGTFKPISTENIIDHPMHEEQIYFSYNALKNIRDHHGKIICTGTTSLRAMESLYWYSVLLKQNAEAEFRIEKLLPYSFGKQSLPDREESLDIILTYMKNKEIDFLLGSTSIFIFPPYKFHFCDGLITNFHLPKSTLILLVAAFAGDQWKTIYEEALTNDYRFLSYGDSSLILR